MNQFNTLNQCCSFRPKSVNTVSNLIGHHRSKKRTKKTTPTLALELQSKTKQVLISDIRIEVFFYTNQKPEQGLYLFEQHFCKLNARKQFLLILIDRPTKKLHDLSLVQRLLRDHGSRRTHDDGQLLYAGQLFQKK